MTSKPIAEKRIPANCAEPDPFADHRQKSRCGDDTQPKHRDRIRIFVEESHADRHGPEDLRIMRGCNLAGRRDTCCDEQRYLSRRRAEADEGKGGELVQIGHDELGIEAMPLKVRP